MKLSRRTFTKIGLLVAIPKTAIAATGCYYLRPPGAVEEADFLARCNRCQKCVQICPTRVVFPASFKYGIIKANTPVVLFGHSYCNSCLKCSIICPTKALEPVTEDTLDIGVGVIIKDCCVAWDWEGCTVCVDKCPLKAIYLDENKRPVVIPEKCNGCGICQKECPSTSLRMSIKGKGIIIKPRPFGTPSRDAAYEKEKPDGT